MSDWRRILCTEDFRFVAFLGILRAAPLGLGQLIMDLTGLGLGWAWSTWARAGLGRELVSPWRTLFLG